MIIINNIKLTLDEKKENAIDKAISVLNTAVNDAFIYKTAVDARKAPPVFVVSVGVRLSENEKDFVLKLNNPNVTYKEEYEFNPEKGQIASDKPPVIIGFGPAGLFCGLALARYGFAPVIIEQGGSVEERDNAIEKFIKTGILNTKNNVQFGEGGAGTYSDGKLTTRINDPKCSFVLKELVKFGAPEDILTKAKPHIGTDCLKKVVVNIRKEIEALGGKVYFNTKAEDIIIKNGRAEGVKADNGEIFESSNIILASGHSSRDIYYLLNKKNIELAAKPFSAGVRIEHLQEDINKATYGAYAGHKALPPAEYTLSKRFGDRGVYSFCMCPGGVVVPAASEENSIVTNGMSEYKRNGINANSAIAVSVLPEDFECDPLKGIEYQRKMEQLAFNLGGRNYKAPSQTVASFIDGTVVQYGKVCPSYALGTKTADISKALPQNITMNLKNGLKYFNTCIFGFCGNGAVLTGVETRTSSPVRILRNEGFESVSVQGLFPCGEGAGYAGGIMSAAADGLKIAEKIINTYKPAKD